VIQVNKVEEFLVCQKVEEKAVIKRTQFGLVDFMSITRLLLNIKKNKWVD